MQELNLKNPKLDSLKKFFISKKKSCEEHKYACCEVENGNGLDCTIDDINRIIKVNDKDVFYETLLNTEFATVEDIEDYILKLNKDRNEFIEKQKKGDFNC
ncbi:hypothetical protein IJ541_04270 [bacterium]|nr:hypothetical protein [bacterium]